MDGELLGAAMFAMMMLAIAYSAMTMLVETPNTCESRGEPHDWQYINPEGTMLQCKRCKRVPHV